jgi:hypothetical protein
LKKKHNAICYHCAREALAAGHIRVCKILGTDNPADLFTNTLTSPRLMINLRRMKKGTWK